MIEEYPRILKAPLSPIRKHPNDVSDYIEPRRRFTFKIQGGQFLPPENLRTLGVLQKYPELANHRDMSDIFSNVLLHITMHTGVHTEKSSWSDAILSCVTDFSMMFCMIDEYYRKRSAFGRVSDVELADFMYQLVYKTLQGLMRNKVSNLQIDHYKQYKQNHIIDNEILDEDIELEFNNYHLSKIIQFYFIVEMISYVRSRFYPDSPEINAWYHESISLPKSPFENQTLYSDGIRQWDMTFVKKYIQKLIRVVSQSRTFYSELNQNISLLDEDFTQHERNALQNILPIPHIHGPAIYTQVLQNIFWFRLQSLRSNQSLNSDLRLSDI